MKFIPSILLPEGQYDFEVLESYDMVSKQGNEMIKLILRVFNEEGRETVVRDYLVAAMAHKISHFCICADLSENYERGELSAADCEGASGSLHLIVSHEVGYDPQNQVKDYFHETGAEPF